MRHWRQLGLCDRDLPLVRTLLILKDSDLIWLRRRRNGDRPYLGRGPPLSPQPNLFRP
jgi:hypothetical protein